jgi:hypothetical protein
LEILKRAKSGGEIVDWNESESNVREEVLRRNAKVGYCNRDGSQISAGKIIMKPANAQYRKNYRKIFGHD